jgi:transposase
MSKHTVAVGGRKRKRSWEVEKSQLSARIRRLERQKAALKAENRRLKEENAAKDRRIEQLQAEVARLQAALAASERAGKRQAAPFSKGPPRAHPRRPGRKPGAAYGRKGHRCRPPRIDEHYQAKLPKSCPHCHGRIRRKSVKLQFQVEIPRQPIYRQFTIPVGECETCGARIQGRHPLQTSDALGAAAVQLGAHLQATIAWLNKTAGMSHGKIVAVLRQVFGVKLTRGGSAQVVLRIGRRCQATVDRIEATVRRSPWVVGDETGWKIGGRPAWLHVMVGDRATCYRIDPHRSVQVQANVIGSRYPGTVVHDGYSSYNRRFPHARHQQCVNHLMRRLKRILRTARGTARKFPSQVLQLFQTSLRLRDEYRQGHRTADELAEAYLGLWLELDELVQVRRRNLVNRQLAKHLSRHIREWFWFLLDPAIDATNYRAEQGLRGGVVNRKVWGGNRTPRGAKAQDGVMTVLETARRQDQDPLLVLEQILHGKPPPLQL